VCFFVGGEIAALRESFVAAGVGAEVGFLACVRAQMRFQVEVEGESFCAEVADEGFLAGVHQLVAFEFGVVEEAFAAALDLANVLLK